MSRPLRSEHAANTALLTRCPLDRVGYAFHIPAPRRKVSAARWLLQLIGA